MTRKIQRCALATTLLFSVLSPATALVPTTELAKVRFQDDNAIYTAQVASSGPYEYVLTFDIYFKGNGTKALIVTPTDLVFEPQPVAEISGDFAKPNAIALKACIGEVCRQLGIKTKKILNDKTGILLEADPGKRGLVRGEIVHLEAAAGWVNLKKTADETTTASPKLSTILPQLAGDALAIFTAKPKFKFSLSPLTEDQMNAASGEDAASLFFGGGLKRSRSSYQYGLYYSGTLATAENISFSQIKAGLDLDLNLLGKGGGFLPLTFHGGAESDQDMDLVNGTAGLSLEYLLPINLNFSPEKAYIPNTGPVFQILVEAGSKLSESNHLKMMRGNPDDFFRIGYSFRWTIPVARDTVLRFHAAGIRVSSSDLTEDESHSLREFSLETKIGNLDYYFGFQKGEAAPLFQPIETTQAGILLKFGDKFECSKPSGGADLSCDKL